MAARLVLAVSGTNQETKRLDLRNCSGLTQAFLRRKGFAVEVEPVGLDMFEVSAADARSMISLLLQRQRQRSDLSLAQVAERLGVKSRNAYARYEQGVSVPTVEKLDELLRAVAPGRHLVLQQSAA